MGAAQVLVHVVAGPDDGVAAPVAPPGHVAGRVGGAGDVDAAVAVHVSGVDVVGFPPVEVDVLFVPGDRGTAVVEPAADVPVGDLGTGHDVGCAVVVEVGDGDARGPGMVGPHLLAGPGGNRRAVVEPDQHLVGAGGRSDHVHVAVAVDVDGVDAEGVVESVVEHVGFRRRQRIGRQGEQAGPGAPRDIVGSGEAAVPDGDGTGSDGASGPVVLADVGPGGADGHGQQGEEDGECGGTETGQGDGTHREPLSGSGDGGEGVALRTEG